MKRYRRKPEEIEVTTFEELVECGIMQGANLVNGMPLSFHFCSMPVTHENDDCYLIGDMRLNRGELFVRYASGMPTIFDAKTLNRLYELIN